MIPGFNADSFNPRIFYLSREHYNDSNSLSSHFHPFCVIMYTFDIKGSGWYLIEGRTYQIEKGSIVVCNPAIYHEKILKPGTEICEYHIAFDNVNLKDLPANCVLNAASHAVINAGDMRERIDQDFLEALEEQKNAYPGFKEIVKAIAMKLIILTFRMIYSNACIHQTFSSPSSEQVPAPIAGKHSFKADKHMIVESIRKYLNENYHRNISIGSIAETLHITHVYLSRIFKQELGESPVSYLIKLRMNMARELLESGGFSVKSAAKSVGYEDSSYFSRQFKSHFGLPPSEYMHLPGQ